jgi:hypothetical protein
MKANIELDIQFGPNSPFIHLSTGNSVARHHPLILNVIMTFTLTLISGSSQDATGHSSPSRHLYSWTILTAGQSEPDISINVSSTEEWGH